MNETIALFGAGGAVGHALATTFDRQNVAYREVGRTKAVRADFFTGEGVREAADGIEVVYYLAGAPYTEFYKHPIMVRNALDAAQAAGVKRFVHIAPVYSYGPPIAAPVPETQPHKPNTRKGRFRLEQEQAVIERNSPSMQTIVVHLPDFYGPYADLSYANAFIHEAVSGKTASWMGPLEAQREFIFTGDIAAPLLSLADRADAYGRCWNLGGRSVRAGDFVHEVFAALGSEPEFRTVPKIALQAFGLINPLMREVAEMYYLFESNFVLDDSALRSKIGDYDKTTTQDAIRKTIDSMQVK